MSTTTNGRDRKTLAEQLDRLEGILDALGDGLNEAIALAVGQALQKVLTGVLTDPDALARLRQVMGAQAQPPPAPTPPPTPLAPPPPQPVGWSVRLLGWIGDRLRLAAAVAAFCAQVAWEAARPYRRWLLVAGCVGLAAALTVYLAGPCLGALAGWVGGFLAALAIQARAGLRRLTPP